jgi:bacterioferritin-associated ferredoxin
MYVCICHAVTEHELGDHVARGAHSEEQIGEICGAGTGCGTCLDEIASLVDTFRRGGAAREPAAGGGLRPADVRQPLDVRPRRAAIASATNGGP